LGAGRKDKNKQERGRLCGFLVEGLLFELVLVAFEFQLAEEALDEAGGLFGIVFCVSSGFDVLGDVGQGTELGVVDEVVEEGFWL